MKNWIKKTINCRKLLKVSEIKKTTLKNLLNYNQTNFEFKFNYNKFFKVINNNSSISKIKNYCVNLKNSRSVFKKFKLSRHQLKLFASNGYIIGLKKSSF